jgi:hypothetical protein
MNPRLLAVPLVCALALPLPARADADASGVYKDLLKSVVWIHSPRGGGKAASGTGSLIDADRRLVLTNYHVVGDVDRALVLFPHTERGKVVAERDYYLERLKRYGIWAKVVARDKKADLALIQLEGLPAGVVPIKLAPASAEAGQNVHSVGNPGDSGALWVYTAGKVRQVYHKKWKAKVGDDTLTFEAEIVETDSATNPGDSGGPLANDKGLLVGVTQGGAVGARLLSTFVDVSEVKQFLDTRTVKDIRAPETTVKPAGRAVVVKDEAKFFGDKAVEKATEEVHELYRKYARDLLVETFKTPPPDELEKFKAMDAQEKAKFFRGWAEERARAEGLVGVYVLITREPGHLEVIVSSRARRVFDDDFVKKLVKELLARFKAKEYDEGLAATVKMVREQLEAEVKP